MKYYVGVKKLPSHALSYEVFKSDVEPTKQTHGHLYNCTIGPFKTKRGANWLAKNPYCQCVADAEELAKLEAAKNNVKTV